MQRIVFWEHVARNSNGCWEWIGPRDRKGYGHFGKLRRAHRASWEMHMGPIPDGLLVCHTCDNPPCVNPNHLFLGTDLDNAHDRDSKGRRTALRGEAHGRAVLTEADVREIRSIPNRHGVTAALARKYGVSFATIKCVRNGTSWKSVT